MKIVGHKLSFLENIYLFEIVRGLVITTRHFFYNMFFHVAHLLGYQQDVTFSRRQATSRGRLRRVTFGASAPLATSSGP